ncbi:hypothetical protein GAMM_40002 [Gammaproteobacteria bacterium]
MAIVVNIVTNKDITYGGTERTFYKVPFGKHTKLRILEG